MTRKMNRSLHMGCGESLRSALAPNRGKRPLAARLPATTGKPPARGPLPKGGGK